MNIKPILLILSIPAVLTAAPPANDQFASATRLSGKYVTFSGTTVEATSEVGEPENNSPNTVWYKWTAPAYGTAKLAGLFDSSTKHYMEVYVGTAITSLTNVWTSYETEEPQFSVIVGKGTTYYIRMTSPASNPSTFSAIIDLDTTGFNQSVFQGTTYTNDNFNQAKALTGARAKAVAYCGSATREAGEPLETGMNSLWWKWTAPYDGKAIISTNGSDVGTKNRLTVGSGSRLSEFQYTSESWDYEGSLVLDAKKGRTYYIALGETNYFGLENSAYILNIDHTKDAGNSPGTGFKGKFTTMPIDILNHSKVKGLFSAKGMTDFALKYDTSRFIVDSGFVSGNFEKWNFAIHKKSFSDAPMSGKFTVIGLKNGKAVAKVTKTFRVW